MKIRIKPGSTGKKGRDWQRVYKVEYKSFLFWRNFKVFTDKVEALAFTTKFIGDCDEVVFVVY